MKKVLTEDETQSKQNSNDWGINTNNLFSFSYRYLSSNETLNRIKDNCVAIYENLFERKETKKKNRKIKSSTSHYIRIDEDSETNFVFSFHFFFRSLPYNDELHHWCVPEPIHTAQVDTLALILSLCLFLTHKHACTHAEETIQQKKII